MIFNRNKIIDLYTAVDWTWIFISDIQHMLQLVLKVPVSCLHRYRYNLKKTTDICLFV